MATIAMSVATGVFFSTYVGLRIAIGSCPTYEPIEDFDAENFKGIWYEMQRDKSFFATGECITAEYGDTEDAAKISVKNTQYFPDESKKDGVVGYAYVSTFFPGRF